jgi:hypothetical protein
VIGDDPKLSIVLASSHAWPEAERTLRALLDADSTTDFEVILCAGGTPPPATFGDRRLSVLVAPGESVFALRAQGIERARGEIVAITEDHCIPAPDWAAALVSAHARHPDAVGLSGAVANGATASAWDWANFLMTFAEHMPPLDGAAAKRAPSVANGSFKRAPIDATRPVTPGWVELELMPRLVGAGAVARDGGPLVTHDQSHGGVWANLVAHFHNGRASAGLRVERPGVGSVRAEWRRLATLPWRLTRELQTALAARPPLTGVAARGARLGPLLALAHAAGELVGLLSGPGSSAERLD